MLSLNCKTLKMLSLFLENIYSCFSNTNVQIYIYIYMFCKTYILAFQRFFTAMETMLWTLKWSWNILPHGELRNLPKFMVLQQNVAPAQHHLSSHTDHTSCFWQDSAPMDCLLPEKSLVAQMQLEFPRCSF